MFRLRHPTEPRTPATCGYDATERGYFVDLTSDGVLISYDATEHGVYDDKAPLLGALSFLSSFGFVSAADVDDALAFSAAGVTECPPKRIRRALRVLRGFEESAE